MIVSRNSNHCLIFVQGMVAWPTEEKRGDDGQEEALQNRRKRPFCRFTLKCNIIIFYFYRAFLLSITAAVQNIRIQTVSNNFIYTYSPYRGCISAEPDAEKRRVSDTVTLSIFISILNHNGTYMTADSIQY